MKNDDIFSYIYRVNTHDLGSLKSKLRRILTGVVVRQGQTAARQTAERVWPQVRESEQEAGLCRQQAA